MKQKNKPELLAPAGDLEKLKWAIEYGADAVYCGGPALGMRANAKNFSFAEIKEGCEFAHKRGKRVHVTINIVLHNQELKEIITYLKQIEACGVDAIIVSDPTIIQLAKQHTQLELHLSTQQSTLNLEACKFWEKQGVKRIVMARETNKNDLKEIIEKTNLEIEYFIHGAMCASMSGRCVLSNFLTARDSNRGGCSQICRWDFTLLDALKKELKGMNPFTFCAKDLSMLTYIPEMIDMGITSFKIEGRMRSIYYIATIVDVYRKVIDEYCNHPQTYQYNKAYEKIVRNCANRDSIPQFFGFENDETCGYYNGREEISNQDFLGIILEYNEQTNIAIVEQRNYFKIGDTVEIFGPQHPTISYQIKEIKDENGDSIEIVRHPKQVVTMKIEGTVVKNDLIRIQKD